MNEMEQKQAAKAFATYWQGKGDEKQDTQSFWISLLQNVLGVEDATKFIQFEMPVKIEHVGFIDGYITETKVLIEQKGINIGLNKGYAQSDGSLLTPYQQARRYAGYLPHEMNPRWIVVCNFAEIHIHDMNHPNNTPDVILLKDLEKEYYRLNFLVQTTDQLLKQEEEVSVKAGELVGKLYNALAKQYKNPDDEQSQKSLNELCVRLVFCLYAEDAGLFGGHTMFHDYLRSYAVKDVRRALIDLFAVLDTEVQNRDPYLVDELAAFPYVNGGLFANKHIEVPQFTEEIVQVLLEKASEDFDWSHISPTIFGAVFESTLNPETRRSGGMHYTSVANIHKVIDPLFLDDLKAELETIRDIKVVKTRDEKLDAFQQKLASLTFLDPACGSGNFLTESYIALRRLENEALKIRYGDKMTLGFDDPIKVSIGQFYGIEINDFAVTVAKTALWIAESQMHKETMNILPFNGSFLPLRSYANIVEGNALRMDWEDVVPKAELDYIMGNPPFVGHQWRTKEQNKDMEIAFHDLAKHGKLDYVCAWYNKAADYMQNTKIKAAFVSTNSINQGESVGILWKFLTESKNVEIQFAHKSFVWSSEAIIKAAVHCVIIGFSCYESRTEKILFCDGLMKKVNHINGYLVEADDIYIQSRGKCLKVGYPEMFKGSQPTDGSGLILEKEDYELFCKEYPDYTHLVRKYIGSYEFINNKERYCLWLQNVPVSEYKNNSFILERLKIVKEFRKTSATASVREFAEYPSLFTQIRQPSCDYLAFPAMSSSRRKYMPIGYIDSSVIASNQLYIIPNASLFLFGVLTSNVHMAWMRTVCGRLKSDYRYAPAIYNNFPFPDVTEKEKSKIEGTAQAILDAREKENCSLAELYDPDFMPPDLRKAHQQNDRAVMEAYGFDIKTTTEASCVAELMKMYQKLTEETK